MFIPVAKIQAGGVVHHQLRVWHHVPILRAQLPHGLYSLYNVDCLDFPSTFRFITLWTLIINFFETLLKSKLL